jgi:urea transport system substrate-binding protein
VSPFAEGDAADPASGEHCRKRVLVVEDDEDVRVIVAMELEALGHEVVQAENGRAALEAIEQARPNLILLDMRMPVMDGWHFASELKRRHGRVAPIVVLTAAPDARERAREVGADGWLSKPFELAALFDVVTRQLG